MKFDRDEILKELDKRGANKPCHRCGNESFSIIDGYSKLFVEEKFENIGTVSIGGPILPMIMVACLNCGAVTLHALGAFTKLPVEDKDAKQ